MQLPTGSCVLKQCIRFLYSYKLLQLPTGSCVLKLVLNARVANLLIAATYG